MKPRIILLLLMTFHAVPSLGADSDFFLHVKPLDILSPPDVDEYSSSCASKPSQIEKVDAKGNYLPNIKMGLGIGGPESMVNFGIGGGYLSNNLLKSTFVSVDVSPRLKISENATIGPHLAYLVFASPEWGSSAQLDISGNRGLMSGFALHLGKDAGLTLSVDYVDTVFNAKTKQGSDWQINHENINLSGMSIQFGLSGNF